MTRKLRIPELRVVFDTSVLVTEAVSELIRREVVDIIQNHSKHPDLRVSWCIPTIVLHERRYQMQQRAHDLLPQIGKTEKLLGHNLNITQDILDQRVQAVLDAAIAKLNLTLIHLDTTKVDWSALIEAAAYRRPPFEAGKKEKGFRDAIALECVAQLVLASPQTPSVCLIAFVSSDAVLAEAARNRIGHAGNVRILETIDDLIALINTLISQVGEDVVEDIRKRANGYFFKPQDKTTFYYKGDVLSKIRGQVGTELSRIPEGATFQDEERITIGWPEFQRKEARRFHWITRITFTYKLSRQLESPPAPEPGRIYDPSTFYADMLTQSAPTPNFVPTANTLSGLLGLAVQSRQSIGSAKKTVEVHWSVSVDVQKRLSSAQIHDLRFAGVSVETPGGKGK